MKKRAATTGRSTVRIEALGAFGDGLAADAGGPIAVPFTAPGDLVDIETSRRGRHRSARLRRVVEAGPDRVEPGCRHFERCGGCRLQHISDHAYAAWKDGLWRTALVRAGIPEKALAQAHIHPLRRVAPKSRRRARLAVHRGRVGFRQEKSHRIEPIESCLVLHPKLLSVARALASTFDKVRLSASEISLSLLDDGVEAVIHADGALDYSALQDLADLAESLDLARL
ncbi:MAG: class I SAM-dependent RNA methyltransferase, partial [Pseudomonadota bacterium]